MHPRLPKTRALSPNQAKSIFIVRLKVVMWGVILMFSAIIIKLSQWQLLKAEQLELSAQNQYQRTITNTGYRGTLYTSDANPLVTNQQRYRLFAHPHLLTDSPEKIAEKIISTLDLDPETQKNKKDFYIQQLEKPVKWVGLEADISLEEKQSIENLKLVELGFDPYLKRYYPEASLAAHLVGFVGKTSDGEDIGYFGIEGALEAELKARTRKKSIIADAVGRELFPDYSDDNLLSGRDIYLTIRKDVQFIVEQQLQKALVKYGAKSGEVIVLEPKTGKLLAHATLPTYNPENFNDYQTSLYKNPSLASLYEPGSTFKVLTVAAGIDAGKITPETPCSNCAKARVIDKYTIRTWNDQYTPNIDMQTALAKSDNTAMIFITDLLGRDLFLDYLKKFGVGEPVGVELQEDSSTPLPKRVGPVELATLSFGQGIMTNSFKIAQVVATIANQGVMMKPTVIEKIYDPATDSEIVQQPKEVRRVISQQSAKTVTEMMILAANKGEAQWVATDEYLVAGKTGTSQVAGRGGYDKSKTIASFVGFAPALDPDYVLMVKLVEPTSSPWAAETAAPLWYDISDRLRIALKLKQ